MLNLEKVQIFSLPRFFVIFVKIQAKNVILIITIESGNVRIVM